MGLQDLIREDEAREDLEMSSVSLSFVAISVALKGIFVETLLFWLLGHDLQNLGSLSRLIWARGALKVKKWNRGRR